MNRQDPFDHIDASPLDWPSGVPRTDRPQRSNFKEKRKGEFRRRTVHSAIGDLKKQVKLLGGKNLIISTNLATKKNGMPYSNAAEPDDSGAAIYFTIDGEPACYPNDKYDRVADNIYGIAKIIEAQRGIERWGTEENVRSAFQGFKMIPEKTSGQSWWDYFKVDPQNADKSDISRAYRQKVKKVHPDKPTGSSEAFQVAQEMKRQAVQALKN